MTITFAFALLKIRFVLLGHLEIEWISFSVLLICACRRLTMHVRYNLYHLHLVNIHFLVLFATSATHRLNNIGSNIESCDAPNSDVRRVEK